jgi:hypothetical protein
VLSLLGDEAKWSEKVCGDGKKLCNGLTRAAKRGQKSLVPAGQKSLLPAWQAQRRNYGRTLSYVPNGWVTICLSFKFQQSEGAIPFWSLWSCFWIFPLKSLWTSPPPTIHVDTVAKFVVPEPYVIFNFIPPCSQGLGIWLQTGHRDNRSIELLYVFRKDYRGFKGSIDPLTFERYDRFPWDIGTLKKKVSDFPVPSRDVTNQTLPD